MLYAHHVLELSIDLYSKHHFAVDIVAIAAPEQDALQVAVGFSIQ